MQKITIKEKEDKVILVFEPDLSRLNRDYWNGIYIKELYYCSVQSANRNYSYIDISVIRQMLPDDWYIDFNVVNKIAFFSLISTPKQYIHRWYGESLAQKLIEGYSVEFIKMEFSDNGELVV